MQKPYNKVKHFTDLIVWQKAHSLFVDMYIKFDNYPRKTGVKTVIEQIFRSCGSISANIAEGFNSRSTKKYVNYLEIAQKSAAETENWVYKIGDCRIIRTPVINPWIDICDNIQRMLQSLMTNLEKKRR
jgi:four helix bundle protein